MTSGRSVAFYGFLHQQTDRPVITDILLKVALNTITHIPPPPHPNFFYFGHQIFGVGKKNPTLRPDVLAKISKLQMLQKNQNICYTTYYHIPTIVILPHTIKKCRRNCYSKKCSILMEGRHDQPRTLLSSLVKISPWFKRCPKVFVQATDAK